MVSRESYHTIQNYLSTASDWLHFAQKLCKGWWTVLFSAVLMGNQVIPSWTRNLFLIILQGLESKVHHVNSGKRDAHMHEHGDVSNNLFSVINHTYWSSCDGDTDRHQRYVFPTTAIVPVPIRFLFMVVAWIHVLLWCKLHFSRCSCVPPSWVWLKPSKAKNADFINAWQV